MSPSKFEVWIVNAPRASQAGEASDESEQADSDQEESNSGTVRIGLMAVQSCSDCCVTGKTLTL